MRSHIKKTGGNIVLEDDTSDQQNPASSIASIDYIVDTMNAIPEFHKPLDRAAGGISPLLAAQLSWAGYQDLRQGSTQPYASGVPGWQIDPSYSYADSGPSGTGNQYLFMFNQATGQAGFVFRGTQPLNGNEWYSDFEDAGGTNWKSLQVNFEASLVASESAYSGYSLFTDGHSLGGGLAQTGALDAEALGYNLSGYGQNSLPVSDEATFANGQTYSDLLATWQAKGNLFSEANVAGDPATFLYGWGSGKRLEAGLQCLHLLGATGGLEVSRCVVERDVDEVHRSRRGRLCERGTDLHDIVADRAHPGRLRKTGILAIVLVVQPDDCCRLSFNGWS